MADKKQDTVDTKVPSGTFDELKVMVTDYAKQQTVEPLKHLGKWVGFGLAGAVCLTIGGLLTGLGLLRLVQKADSLDGNWNFAPYLIVFALLMALAGLCFYAATKTPEWMDDDK